MNDLQSLKLENLLEEELQHIQGGDSIFREAGRAVGRFFRDAVDAYVNEPTLSGGPRGLSMQ